MPQAGTAAPCGAECQPPTVPAEQGAGRHCSPCRDSGERTDILAHVMGIAAGGLFGVVYGVPQDGALLAPWHGHALGVAAILDFALAWAIALPGRG